MPKSRSVSRTWHLPLLLAIACASVGSSPDASRCGVVPVATGQLPPELRLRARASFRARGREIRLELVARGTPEELVVVGLTPYGARLFSLSQRGRDAAVDPTASRELEPLPWWALDALHRSLWIAPPQRLSSAGVARWDRGDEQVREWREDGHRRREFTRRAAPASTPVSIEYPGTGAAGSAAGIEIRNPHCGYEAVIVTLEAGGSG